MRAAGWEDEDQADAWRRREAIRTWGIGIYEHEHITDNIYGCQRTRELYGLCADERLSVAVFAGATYPADAPMLLAAIQKAHDPEGDGCFDVLHRIVRRDGAVLWLHTKAKTTFHVVDGVRAPLLTTGSLIELTATQELKIALQQQEERLRHATEASKVGIFELNMVAPRAPQKLYWSPTFREICGYGAETPAQLEWFVAHTHPDDREGLTLAIRQCNDPVTQTPMDLEHRWIHPDGTLRWLLTRATASFSDASPSASLERVVGTILDITKRKVAEESLAQRSAILDATPDFVSITDTEGRFLYLNKAGREYMGFAPEEPIGQRTMMEVLPTDDGNSFQKLGLPAASQVDVWRGDSSFRTVAGTSVPMSHVILAHRNKRRELTHFSNIARNISHEKELEHQFRQAQKMEAIGKLAGGVAHDFNNLLSVIMGFSELLEKQFKPGEAGTTELGQIQLAAERAGGLTRQLLAYSRKQILQPRILDINEVLKTTGSMIERIVGENVELSLVLHPGSAKVKADPSQIDQVLLNLVVNAKDAMPDGGRLAIETQVTELDGAPVSKDLSLPMGRYVVILVSDTGHGMDEQTRERMFDPFFTTKGQGQGTGLGLSTVLGIVRQSGGGVWVSSTLGRGTTFKIFLPRTDEEVQSTPQAKDPLGGNSEATILVAEDDPQLRQMVTAALREAGYRVLSASDPVEALRILQDFEGPLDLLLTDVVMPHMTGKQLANAVTDKFPHALVLYVSGYTEDAIVRHGVLEEGIHFLPKPLGANRLLRTVRSMLRRGDL